MLDFFYINFQLQDPKPRQAGKPMIAESLFKYFYIKTMILDNRQNIESIITYIATRTAECCHKYNLAYSHCNQILTKLIYHYVAFTQCLL